MTNLQVDCNNSALASMPATNSELIERNAPGGTLSTQSDQPRTDRKLKSRKPSGAVDVPRHDDSEPFEGFADFPQSKISNENNHTAHGWVQEPEPSHHRSRSVHDTSSKKHEKKDSRGKSEDRTLDRASMLAVENTFSDLGLETRIAMERVRTSLGYTAAETRYHDAMAKLENKRLRKHQKNERRKEKEQQAFATLAENIVAPSPVASPVNAMEAALGEDHVNQPLAMVDRVNIETETRSESSRQCLSTAQSHHATVASKSGLRRQPTREVKLMPSIEHDDMDVVDDMSLSTDFDVHKIDQDVVMKETAAADALTLPVSPAPATPRRSALKLPSTPSSSPPKSVRIDESQNQIRYVPPISRYRRSLSPTDEVSVRRREKERFSYQSDEEKDAELDDWESAILTQEQEEKRSSYRSITSHGAKTSAATDPTLPSKKRKRLNGHDDTDVPSAKQASTTKRASPFPTTGTLHDEAQRPESAAEGRSIKPIKAVDLVKTTSAPAHGSDYRRAIRESIRNLDAARKPRKRRPVRRSASDPGDSDKTPLLPLNARSTTVMKSQSHPQTSSVQFQSCVLLEKTRQVRRMASEEERTSALRLKIRVGLRRRIRKGRAKPSRYAKLRKKRDK